MHGRFGVVARSRALLVLVAVGALAGRAWAEERPASTVRKGSRFVVTCDFASDRAADAALRVVEAMYAPTVALYGPVAPPAELLPVFLYRTPDAFVLAEGRLTNGAFARNLAFVHHASRTAHVAVQPLIADEVLDRFGTTPQTLRLLGHEAAHLVRMHAAPKMLHRHPEWVVDGVADWVSRTVLAETGVLAAGLEDPDASGSARLAQHLIVEGLMPHVTSIMRDEAAVEALGFDEAYVVRGLLVAHIMTGPYEKAFRRALRGRKLEGTWPEARRAWTDAFLADVGDAEALDASFRRYVMGLTPPWMEVFRALSRHGDGWLQTAFDRNAVAWRMAPQEGTDYRLSAELELLPGREQQANLLLDRDTSGFVSLALRPGHVNLFTYDAKSDAWTSVANAPAPRLRIGEPARVEAVVRSGRVRVSIQGDDLLEADLSARNWVGAWGLGALAGSAVYWRSVERHVEGE